MLRFTPTYRVVRWGDRRLADEFGRTLPDGPVGEAWELVELGSQHSQVRDGPRAGERLGELWRRGALGGSARGPFPFLLKWLTVADWLSVQVHPDAQACAALGFGAPKTEAWYVARAAPGALLLLGHYAGLDAATLRQAVAGGSVRKWLYEVCPRVGDLYLVPAGTVHSLGPGLVLLEVQQPGDTTFRLYDWDRRDLDGGERPLHVAEACAAVRYDAAGPPRAQRREVVGPGFSMRVAPPGSQLPPVGLRVLVAPTGPVTIATRRGVASLAVGEVVVAEPEDGELEIGAEPCLAIGEAPAR